MRIGITAPSGRFSEQAAAQVAAIARDYPDVDLVFHPQCFRACGHFAGPDDARADAFVEFANDPSLDALWFARGGYGACRIAEAAIARLAPQARDKQYLGYSDAGYLLAGLCRAGFPNLAHAPMPQDVLRAGGEKAIRRTLDWLTARDPEALEPGLDPGGAHVAFNLTVLGLLLGTGLEPDLGGHVLLIEEVSEPMYRIDRAMFHLGANLKGRGLAGLRLGRCSDIPANDPDFAMDEESVVRFWCERNGLQWLGRADIGHDEANRVVPFGRL